MIPAGPPLVREALSKLAGRGTQEALSNVAWFAVGVVTGVAIIVKRINETVCAGPIFTADHPCIAMQQSANTIGVGFGAVGLVAIVAVIAGRLIEQEELLADDDPDAATQEASD